MINLKEARKRVVDRFIDGIMLSSLSDKEIDERIKNYLNARPPGEFYYSDIADALNIDLRSIVGSCMRLEKEGIIKGLKK